MILLKTLLQLYNTLSLTNHHNLALMVALIMVVLNHKIIRAILGM